MQRAPGRAVGSGPKQVEVEVVPRPKSRRRLRPATIGIAALVTLLTLGAMIAALVASRNGQPLIGSTGPEVTIPTPTSLFAVGIKVEKAGSARTENEQVIVPLKVTNNVMQPPPVQGTHVAGAATPQPEQAKINNATVKVLFYDKPSSDATRKVVGSAIGNVQDLKFGESKQIDVVATAVGEFCDGCYEAFPDTVWTDKDVVKANGAP
ncbi:MAG TPA: hypothetical protein VM409_03555 [Chloroflexia bacterium]|nr:hypothetical protein [Chloroflexia bacterium]